MVFPPLFAYFVVTPCVGVWIEIGKHYKDLIASRVTPCVGVWIEIELRLHGSGVPVCHSLRGSVD